MKASYFVLDGVLGLEEVFSLYHDLLDSRTWTLRHLSQGGGAYEQQFHSFPSKRIEYNGEVFDEYYSGYFRSLVSQIRRTVQQEHQLKLPSAIQRMILTARKSHSKTKPHIDSPSDTAWTVLGFLSPVWDKQDGGGFEIEGEQIENKTSRFVVFKSNVEHCGGMVTNQEMANWRIILNIVLDEPEKVAQRAKKD